VLEIADRFVGTGIGKEPTLPPDGTPIRVSPRGAQVAWISAAIYALLAIGVASYGIQIGRPIVGFAFLGFVLAAVSSLRNVKSGIVLGVEGVTGRGRWWRTDRWRWDEIDHFELREQDEKLRLRVHLCNGEAKKFAGFSTRSLEEEERAQALIRALRMRLESEQGGGGF
jgi:hypothetical protein